MPRLTTAMAAMAHTATASALLMPMLTTAMLDMVDLTAMARGPLRLTTAMAHTDTARGLLMPRLTTDLAMAHTDTARGPLRPTTDMAATAHTDTASKLGICSRGEDTSGIN